MHLKYLMHPKISYTGAGTMVYTDILAIIVEMEHHPTGLESCWCLQSL